MGARIVISLHPIPFIINIHMRKKTTLRKLSMTKQTISTLSAEKIKGGSPWSVPLGGCTYMHTEPLTCALATVAATATQTIGK